MRFKHWTPQYVFDRLIWAYDQARHPADPWLTRNSIDFLSLWLKSSDTGVEFGSGRSTVWFGNRVKHVTSVEDIPDWYQSVRQKITALGLSDKVDLIYFAAEPQDENSGTTRYVGVLQQFANQSLDFCLIDGGHRDFCALHAIEKIKSGGILIVDNVNWFLPLPGQCLHFHSPASRTEQDGCVSKAWGEFARNVADWRRIWTTNGVNDTAIFFKPV